MIDRRDGNASQRAGARITRRDALGALVAGSTGLAAALRGGATVAAEPGQPPVTFRDYSAGAAPLSYPDPDVLVVHPSFNALRVFNAPLQRLWTGALWSEGPAWCAQGRYLVWSDIPNDRQLRWSQDDGRVSVMRQPSGNSNGNTFDYQGRQLSCEHLHRRVVRYEHDGTVTVLADAHDGMPLNSPNDVIPHPDGSYWFTDPPYGAQLYEGAVDAAGGQGNREGRLNPRAGQPAGVGAARQQQPTHVYRVDPAGRVGVVIDGATLPGIPNGLAFSPDHRRLYVVCAGTLLVGEVSRDARVSGVRQLARVVVDGVFCGMDGVRVDVHGNLWCSSNAGSTPGYSGVTVLDPGGALIGRIRLPEACANLAFGGPKRNRLFMTASQSLYAVYVNTQGAAPG